MKHKGKHEPLLLSFAVSSSGRGKEIVPSSRSDNPRIREFRWTLFQSFQFVTIYFFCFSFFFNVVSLHQSTVDWFFVLNSFQNAAPVLVPLSLFYQKYPSMGRCT